MSVREFSLGRECVLEIDGEVLLGIADVSVRERTTQLDATGFGQILESSIPASRTTQLIVSFRELSGARQLWFRRLDASGSFLLPRVFDVAIYGGVMEIRGSYVMADIDEDQPIDGGVAAAIQFNEWGHA